MDNISAEQSVKALLNNLGQDLNREGLEKTPKRVLEALREMTSGYEENPATLLSTDFDAEQFTGAVVLRDIHFASVCEHHLLPFTGTAHVGYVPRGRVVGSSIISSLVQCFARRLQLQERLTQQIAHAIKHHLDPKAVGVILKGQHQCISCRGVNQPDTDVVTVQFLGDAVDLKEMLLHGS